MSALGFIVVGWVFFLVGWGLKRIVTSDEHAEEFDDPGHFNNALSGVMGLWMGALGFGLQGLWIILFG